ncbi:MAG TPA: UDP-N-acetylglucosamine pyrophosphorylase [Ruminococcaceae bacterium]|nr:UDP-N-acetylglucosamine pyrophosphorylase [Oscillospiraceae bacterium]
MNRLHTKNLLDLSKTLAAPLLARFDFPWQALAEIGEFIKELMNMLPPEVYDNAGEGIYIAKTAEVAKTADITGPCIIGESTQVRPGAFIRGNVLVGAGAVVGNSTELKNVILFDGVQAPHYNYLGDSILGYKSHMGAGAITSNLKNDKSPVSVKLPDNKIETGLKKFGAVLGDFAEIGCNTVLAPGTVIGRHTDIYPLSFVRGYIPQDSIFKTGAEVVKKI